MRIMKSVACLLNLVFMLDSTASRRGTTKSMRSIVSLSATVPAVATMSPQSPVPVKNQSITNNCPCMRRVMTDEVLIIK